MAEKKRVLGRGLGALIGTARKGAPTGTAPGAAPAEEDKKFFYCAVSRIRPNAAQPRRHFDEAGLQDLAASIREKGVIEPLIIRRSPSSNGFELIAGERRWRAAQMAGLEEVPAVIVEATEEESLELAIIENIQREDLNAMEEAEAYRHLMGFGLSQEEVARRVGKGRATVANYLRLLGLPDEVKEALRDGSVTMGHARAILALGTTQARIRLLREIISKGLSVREAETAAGPGAKGAKSKANAKTRPGPDPAISALEDELRSIFATKTHVKDKNGRGSIEILYYSADERERIIELLRSLKD